MVLRIFEMLVTSGFLAALECTKFVFGRGYVPDFVAGAYSASPDPLAGFRSPTSKGEGRGGEGEGKGREQDKRKGAGRTAPSFANSWIRSWLESC